MSARKKTPADLAKVLPPDVAALFKVGAKRNVRIAFPGITGHVDCPFAVEGGTAIDDCVAELTILISAVTDTLEAISESCGKRSDTIGGCVFMLHAAYALLESMSRAMATGPAGVHE